MRVLTPAEVRSTAFKTLRVPEYTDDPPEREALSALVRRAAAFLAPCTARTLRASVLAGWKGLTSQLDALDAQVEQVIDDLIAYGDLLELPTREPDSEGSSLYLAPPSFVRRRSGAVFVLGISPDCASLLPEGIEERITPNGHARILQPRENEDLALLLRQLGYNEIPETLWRRRPRIVAPELLAKEYDDRLAKSEIRGEVVGLLVLDPNRNVNYYTGRWTAPRSHTGRFIARREQRYGNPLWCYAELSDGIPTHLIDIRGGEGSSAADHAWHLQMALDHLRGTPQQFVATEENEYVVLQLFSPVPRWAQNRWELLGDRVNQRGCLFAYRLPASEFPQERELLTRYLWLDERE